MNPFEQLPNELIYEQCNRMELPDLIRFSQSHWRIYNICNQIIQKKGSDWFSDWFNKKEDRATYQITMDLIRSDQTPIFTDKEGRMIEIYIHPDGDKGILYETDVDNDPDNDPSGDGWIFKKYPSFMEDQDIAERGSIFPLSDLNYIIETFRDHGFKLMRMTQFAWSNYDVRDRFNLTMK